MMFQQTQQAQMRALQSQVQLPQQIGLTFTSAGPVCSSRSFTPSTSQTIYPVTTVQSHSEQHNSVCDNSASLSSSQVHMYILKHRRASMKNKARGGVSRDKYSTRQSPVLYIYICLETRPRVLYFSYRQARRCFN